MLGPHHVPLFNRPVSISPLADFGKSFLKEESRLGSSIKEI
jgi:hypothetical protein